MRKRINEDDLNQVFVQEVKNNTSQLAQIVLNVNNFPIQTPETNDTGRIQRALDSLKATGGKLLFPDGTYNVSAQLTYVFENDVRIILIGGTNSLIKSSTLAYMLHISSTTNIGDVEIYNLNFDAESAGVHWETSNRTQAITVIGCRSVKIQGNKVKNLYGTGIMCNKNISVDISNNVLLNVRGYNNTDGLDNYGDGIYVGDSTRIISIKNNFIRNELSVTQRCGRIGITLEFNVSNAEVEGNYVFGYNRGIHCELTLGGHRIKNNIVEGCLIPFVSITEKGFVESVVENNTFSNKGFINPIATLLFKENHITIGSTDTNQSPKLKFVGNFIEMLNENNVVNDIGLVNSVLISRNNVDFEKNTITVDSTVTGRHFNFGSRENVRLFKNKLINVGNVTMWFSKNCEVAQNEIECASIINQRSSGMTFDKNTIRPQAGLLVLGSILSDRPEGTFNDNTIEKYGSLTIDNTSYSSNAYYLEVSGNKFIKKTADSPTLPTKITTNEEVCDVLYTRRPNTITDEITPANNRNLSFYNSHRTDDGRKIIVATVAPTNRTWKKGDIVYNKSPLAGGYVGWICTVDGTPGTWKGFGLIQA